jgi:NADH-quinone oxidoreductase subunit H
MTSLFSTLFAYDFPYWMETSFKTLAVLVLVPTGALVLGYVFLLKVMSFMQSRLGPMEAGPYGTLQLVMDGLKFLQKEDVIPEKADRRVFALAPLLVLISTFLLYIVIPWGPGDSIKPLGIENFDAGIFFALAVSSLSVIGILMAGWASSNKFALIGALRAAGQLIAYELPLILAVVGVVMQAGTMNMGGIVRAQQDFDVNVFGLFTIEGMPFLVTQFVGFALFIIAAQAELTQPPFDMPVAESELVAGYMTEYTGFRFLLFFMGEFGTAFAFSAIAATLFLGGYGVPFMTLTDGPIDNIVGIAALFTKIMIVAFFIFWFRFTYPRFREDQLQILAWKYLIPISLVNIMVTATFKVVF